MNQETLRHLLIAAGAGIVGLTIRTVLEGHPAWFMVVFVTAVGTLLVLLGLVTAADRGRDWFADAIKIAIGAIILISLYEYLRTLGVPYWQRVLVGIVLFLSAIVAYWGLGLLTGKYSRRKRRSDSER